MGKITSKTQQSELWQPISAPSPVADSKHLLRTLRYLALNPCRSELCSDPIAWYWSTYREVMQTTVEETTKAADQAEATGYPPAQFKIRFHAYASADQTTNRQGTPFPQPALKTHWMQYSISDLITACAAALRMPPSDIQKPSPVRHLFIHLACEQGWLRPRKLAQFCNITPDAAYRILRRLPPAGLKAAELCLDDPRLRSGPQMEKPPPTQLLRGLLGTNRCPSSYSIFSCVRSGYANLLRTHI